MPKIYSHELGIEDCEDTDDLVDSCTVVIAILRDGVDHTPTHIEDISQVYCPSCGWLEPTQPHETACNHVGYMFI